MTATIMPQGRQRYFDNDGNIAAGCLLYAFAAGTSTPKATYQDSAGTVPHAHPIELDAKGEALIYWSGTYKVDLKTAAGAQITGWPVDNIISPFTPGDLSVAAGSGLIGFTYATAYAVGTIGRWLKDLALGTGASFIGWVRSAASSVATTLEKWLNRQQPCVLDFMTDAQIADASLASPVLDHTAAVQAALTAAAGKTLILGPYKFRCTAMLTAAGSIDGQGATIKFVGVTINRLVNQTAAGSMRGFTIDGTGVTNCEYGLFVDTDVAQTGTDYYDLTINNISNGLNTEGCNAALFYKSSSASVNLASHLDIKINVTGVTATSNGVVGDTGGSATGILVAFNGTGCTGNVLIHDSVIRTISSGGAAPAEDSNGIHVTQGDGTSAAAQGQFTIRNCTVFGARKRGYKIQAANTLVEGCYCYGQTTLAGFETYAYGTTFNDCKYLVGTGVGFSSTGVRSKFLKCYAESSAVGLVLALYLGSDYADVLACEFKSTATFSTHETGIVGISGSQFTTIDNTRLTGTTNTGSGIVLTGANDIRFSQSTITGVDTGISLNDGTGKFSVSNRSLINVAGNGVFRTGNGAQTISLCDSEIITATIGIYAESVGNSAIVSADNMKITANTQGILCPSGSRITNCEITSANTTGFGILTTNSVMRGNRITKYDTGISYTFSTTAEVANNVTIGTTTPYLTTGYVAFVEHNNNSR